MPKRTRGIDIYRKDAKASHTLLTPEERERIMLPYLPTPPKRSPSRRSKKGAVPNIRLAESKSHSWVGARKFLGNQFYALVYAIVHAIFSVYIRFRQAYHAVKDRILSILYYHHRTPELIQKDVRALARLPQHLSVILKYEDSGRNGAGLEAVVNELAEIAAWCVCIGIPMLSVYESTGVLKAHIPATHRAVLRKMSSYFGPQIPAVSLRAPHMPHVESAPGTPISELAGIPLRPLSILLISSDDSRDSLVDLTKTLTEMSQKSKLSPKDISIDLIDAEITESVMSEPDLLILFSPSIELSGYPPWQLRLSEIYHVQDNNGVGYQVFLRALYNYANTKMNLGR